MKLSFIILIALSIHLTSLNTLRFHAQISVIQNENFLELRSKQVIISFEKHHSGPIFLKELSVPGHSSLIRKPDFSWSKNRICPLWQFDLLKPNMNFNSNNASFDGWFLEKMDSTIIVNLKWSKNYNDHRFKIEVQVRIKKSDDKTEWTISVESLSRNSIVIRRSVFPIIGDLIPSTKDGDICLGVPSYWGRKYLKAEDIHYQGRYPSARCNMQFMTYYNSSSENGLYIATKDHNGYVKLFSNHKGNVLYPYARAEISALPENESVKNWEIPYVTEVIPYQGTWYQASKYYRRWATTSAPWSIPNIQKRTDRLFKNTLWINGKLGSSIENDFKNSNFTRKTVDVHNLYKTNLGIQLYNWHKYPFDRMYPFYFPPRRGLSDFLLDMTDLDILVVPYINARIVDLEVVQSYTKFQNGACLNSTKEGEEYRIYNYSGNNFVTMCPSSEYWGDVISSVTEKLINDYGFNTVYLDQVGNDAPVRCVSEKHDHIPDPEDGLPFSSGTYWINGYRKILSRMKDNFQNLPGSFIMTENNAEPWNDLIDAFLMIEYTIRDPSKKLQIIPLYQAVYSGYTTTLGLGRQTLPTEKYLDITLYKLALNLIWGSQLGRINVYIYDKRNLLSRYLNTLCQLRERIYPYLQFGEMLFEPNISPNQSTISLKELIPSQGKPYKEISFNEKPILSSFWRLNSDSAVVLLTNYSNKNFHINSPILTLNLVDYGLSKENYILYRIEINKEKIRIATTTDNIISTPVDILPYDAIAYEIVRY